MKFQLQRKHKFLIHSILMGVTIAAFAFLPEKNRDAIFVSSLLLVIIGTFVSQYPNIKVNNFFMNLLLPIHLVMGSILSLIFFPNLAVPVVIAGILSFTLFFYIVLLINNVFLVVEDRSEIIPLYRVASTWSLIILVVVTIPYFAGVFKVPANSFTQNIFVSISSFLFAYYLIWTMRFDRDVKLFGAGEKWMLSLFTAFSIFSLGIATSFIPTESFLRALFVSSVLMFVLSYIQNHLKNTITRKIVTEYIIISVIFLSLLIVFTP